MGKEKSTRSNASQFFVAGELCRRGFCAVVTLGNTPNTDILCSNIEGTKFVHIQVKTFRPYDKTCSVGMKSEKYFGPKFFWVLAGIPQPGVPGDFVYYIIPSAVMTKNIKKGHAKWLADPGAKGQAHNDNRIRVVSIPPKKSYAGWNISRYKNKWTLIMKKLI